MALPTISNNSPSAGSISWTAFGIQYAGQSFTIPAGSSSKRFVWWVYGGGTAPALMDGDALPTLGADDMILFLNKGGFGILVPTAELMDGSLIVNGSILANAISANSIQTWHIDANVITAREIAANAVTATQLSAGSITTDKLGVGTVGDNLIANSSFEEADPADGMAYGWRQIKADFGSMDTVSGVSSSGKNAFRMIATSTSSDLRVDQTFDKFIPVSSASGRKWYVSMRAGASPVASTKGLYLRVAWHDANKNYISVSDVVNNVAVSTTFAVFEGQATPPATARYMSVSAMLVLPSAATTLFIDEVTAREVVISAQIGDGAITAAKILANTITADRIQTGTLTADKLLVSDRTNYWENPDFEGDTVGGIPKGTTNTTTTNSRIIAGGSQSSGKALELNALSGANNDVLSTNVFPVEPGDQYYIRHDYKFLNAVGGGLGGVGFRTYGPTKAALSWQTVAMSTGRPTVWGTHPGAIYTVPAGVYFLQPWVTFQNNSETTNRFHIDDIVVRRMSGGELIVDGAIIAAKIDTDAVTSVKIQANAITALKIAANAVTANHIAANTITGDKIVSNTISALQIQANAVAANHIMAGAITTDKVVVGSFTNMMPDPGFLSPTLTAMRDSGSSLAVTKNATTGNLDLTTAGTGSYYFRPTGWTQNASTYQNWIPVSPGDKIRFWVDLITIAGQSGDIRFTGRTRDGQSTSTSFATANPFTTFSASGSYNYVGEVPAGCYWLLPEIRFSGAAGTASVVANSMVLKPMTGGSLIVDGAIDGQTITGATVQTAASGARIVMDSNGLYGWDANNINYLMADSTGISLTGTLTSRGGSSVNYLNAALGPTVQSARSGVTVATQPGLSFYPDGESTLAPNRVRAGITSTDGLTVTLQGGEPVGYIPDGSSQGPARLKVSQGAVWVDNGSGSFDVDSASISMAAGLSTASLSGSNLTLTGRNSGGVTITAGGTTGVTIAKYGGGRQNVAGVDNLDATKINTNLAAHQRAEFTTSVWSVSGGASWDSGPVVADTGATKTVNNDFCTVGTLSGSINFTKSGYYSISLFVVPRSNPGTGWTAINHSGGERLVQGANNGSMWETYCLTLPVYIAAGTNVRSQMVYTTAHTIDARWKIVKHPY